MKNKKYGKLIYKIELPGPIREVFCLKILNGRIFS